jgi:hypothetical protein
VTATSEFKIGLRAVIAIAVLAAAFVLPTQAFADSCSHAGSDPTAAQYCSSTVVVNETPPTPTPTPTPVPVSTSTSSGSLPFTGLDLAGLVAAAAVLTGTGLALRRIASTGSRKA